MKKNLILTLTLLFAVCVGGTAFAASNPFVDVPKTHWSYDAVDQLVAADVLEGYGTTFSGEKVLTRYEMAQLVAKTMSNNKKVTAEQKAIIDKLSKEYRAELDNMGVHLDEMQNQIDRLKFYGFARVRYDSRTDGRADGKVFKWPASWVERGVCFNLGFEAKLNDDWTAFGRMETYKRTFQDTVEPNFGTVYVPTTWVEGPIGNGRLTAGKFPNFPGHQLIYDNDTTGVKYSFDLGKIKAMSFYGRPVDKASTEVFGTELRYATSPSTNLTLVGVKGRRAGYDASNSGQSIIQYAWGESWLSWDPAARTTVELSADTRVSKNLVLSSGYAQSNANSNNKAYMARFDYKGANWTLPNTWGVWAKYAHIEQLSAIKTGGGDMDPNDKGIQYGITYTPLKNVLFSAWYVNAKHIIHDAGYDPAVKKGRFEMLFLY
ncbi:MAG: S-layer protein [Firmicutes bacterium]|nr:S-layer protein [Bacillota bacterium]